MTNIKKQIWMWLGGLIIVASFFLYFTNPGNIAVPRVEIGGHVIKVEIADTPELRTQGLSLHKPLQDDEGMLFIFDQPSRYSFWMKDMLFAIDMVWIGSDNKIVDITHNAKPESFPETFSPKEQAQYVLEVNAGLAERNNWQIRDEVKF